MRNVVTSRVPIGGGRRAVCSLTRLAGCRNRANRSRAPTCSSLIDRGGYDEPSLDESTLAELRQGVRGGRWYPGCWSSSRPQRRARRAKDAELRRHSSVTISDVVRVSDRALARIRRARGRVPLVIGIRPPRRNVGDDGGCARRDGSRAAEAPLRQLAWLHLVDGVAGSANAAVTKSRSDPQRASRRPRTRAARTLRRVRGVGGAGDRRPRVAGSRPAGQCPALDDVEDEHDNLPLPPDRPHGERSGSGARAVDLGVGLLGDARVQHRRPVVAQPKPCARPRRRADCSDREPSSRCVRAARTLAEVAELRAPLEQACTDAEMDPDAAIDPRWVAHLSRDRPRLAR